MDPFAAHVSFWWALALGVALMTGELVVPALVFLWTGVSCLLTGAVMLLAPGLPAGWALVLWAALSVTTVLAARALNRRHSDRGPAPTLPPNRYGGEFIGMTASLAQDSADGQTRLTLKGANWGVKLPGGDLKAGARVRITAVEGIYLVAEPLEGPA